MKNTTKMMLTTLVGVGMIAGVGTAYADTSTATTPTLPSRGTALITALSQKFNLNLTDLQSFFASFKAEQEAARQAKQATEFTDRLAKAVAAGKITQAQSDLIKTEALKVKSEINALQGKSGTELKNALQSIKAEEAAWVKANNIPVQYLAPGFADLGKGPGRGFGFGKMMGHGPHKDATTTPSSN